MKTMKVLVTGGAGFIGSNIADFYLKKGAEVIIFDNMCRRGVEKNAEWLKGRKGLIIVKGDICNYDDLLRHAKDADIIFHTAAQVGVTTSVKDPRTDFTINALGTLNLLEAARNSRSDPVVVYTSTNKVYGNNVNKIPVVKKETRYEFSGEKFRHGIPEDFPADANEHTPYGSSKYTGDIYTRDYAAVFGLKTIVFRQSCIYGEHQQGCLDQGWVDFIMRSAMRNELVTIFGDGLQVRDILHISDLLKAFASATENTQKTKGEAYNIGGGPENTISILELLSMLRGFGLPVKHSFGSWRPFDQKVYISDIRKAYSDFGWKPLVSKEEGIKRQYEWIKKEEMYST